MTNEEIQIILSNLNDTDLKKLDMLYNSYFREKQAIKAVQKRLDSCENDRKRNLEPTKRETEIKENLFLAQSLPKRKTHMVTANLFGKTKIDELAIDGRNFNPAPLDQREYLKMFFKFKKENVTTNYSYLILALVSLITAINSVTVSIVLGNKILMIISLILIGTSALGTYKHQKNKQITLKIVPKTSISQSQINDFVKILEKEYLKEQEHSVEEQENNTIFLNSIEDICQRRIAFHKESLKEIIREIQIILEKNGASFNEEDIPELQNIIQIGRQKKLTL